MRIYGPLNMYDQSPGSPMGEVHGHGNEDKLPR